MAFVEYDQPLGEQELIEMFASLLRKAQEKLYGRLGSDVPARWELNALDHQILVTARYEDGRLRVPSLSSGVFYGFPATWQFATGGAPSQLVVGPGPGVVTQVFIGPPLVMTEHGPGGPRSM